MHTRSGWTIAAWLMLASTTAHAVDGVCLISQNQTTGAVTMCTGPTSFPVTLSQPGSYRLSSNITVSTGGTAINVTASDVVIDLNGFSISCPPNNCVSAVSGNNNASNVTVKNGAISQFSHAIVLGNYTQFWPCGTNNCIPTSGGPQGPVTSGLVLDSLQVSGSTAVGVILSSGIIRNSTFTGNYVALQQLAGLFENNLVSSNSNGALFGNVDVVASSFFSNGNNSDGNNDIGCMGAVLYGSSSFAVHPIPGLPNNYAQFISPFLVSGTCISQNNSVCGATSC